MNQYIPQEQQQQKLQQLQQQLQLQQHLCLTVMLHPSLNPSLRTMGKDSLGSQKLEFVFENFLNILCKICVRFFAHSFVRKLLNK